MSLCLGNGLCALLELYLNFLSFTKGQEMVFVRFVAVICPMGLSCTGGRIPWAVGEWALQGLASITGRDSLEAPCSHQFCDMDILREQKCVLSVLVLFSGLDSFCSSHSAAAGQEMFPDEESFPAL